MLEVAHLVDPAEGGYGYLMSALLAYVWACSLPLGLILSVWYWNRQLFRRVGIIRALNLLRPVQIVSVGFGVLTFVVYLAAGFVHAWQLSSIMEGAGFGLLGGLIVFAVFYVGTAIQIHFLVNLMLVGKHCRSAELEEKQEEIRRRLSAMRWFHRGLLRLRGIEPSQVIGKVLANPL